MIKIKSYSTNSYNKEFYEILFKYIYIFTGKLITNLHLVKLFKVTKITIKNP